MPPKLAPMRLAPSSSASPVSLLSIVPVVLTGQLHATDDQAWHDLASGIAKGKHEQRRRETLMAAGTNTMQSSAQRILS
jgi:hypothetical protein